MHIDRTLYEHWVLLMKARPVFLLVNADPSFAVRYAEAVPDAHVVIRVWGEERHVHAGNPKDEARIWFQRMRPHFSALFSYSQSVQDRCYWLGLNEPPTESADDRRWVNDFEVERMALLEGLGLKAAIFAFSVGTPPANASAVRDYLPALRAAQRGGHLVAFHEYFANYADDLTVVGQNWGYLCRRYNKTLALAGLTPRDVRVGITECGADVIPQIPISGPYRGRISPRKYVGELATLADWWDQDGVLGGAVFVDGSWNTAQWGLYDISLDKETRKLLYQYIETGTF